MPTSPQPYFIDSRRWSVDPAGQADEDAGGSPSRTSFCCPTINDALHGLSEGLQLVGLLNEFPGTQQEGMSNLGIILRRAENDDGRSDVLLKESQAMYSGQVQVQDDQVWFVVERVRQ